MGLLFLHVDSALLCILLSHSIANTTKSVKLSKTLLQRKGRAVVYEETDDEEEAPTMSMLQTSVQAVKEWMLAFGKPHPRRRGRSKAYKMWMNMGLRAGMLLVIIWAVTMVMTNILMIMAFAQILTPGIFYPDAKVIQSQAMDLTLLHSSMCCKKLKLLPKKWIRLDFQ